MATNPYPYCKGEGRGIYESRVPLLVSTLLALLHNKIRTHLTHSGRLFQLPLRSFIQVSGMGQKRNTIAVNLRVLYRRPVDFAHRESILALVVNYTCVLVPGLNGA